MTPNHPIPPERIRAEAERVVNEFAAKNTRMAAFDSMVWDDRCRERFLALVAAGASLVDVSAVQREAASKAMLAMANDFESIRSYALGAPSAFNHMLVFHNKYLAREHPAPAPRECVLSDGSVVTYNRLSGRMTRKNVDGFDGSCDGLHWWPGLLNRPTDTGADFDALKQFAERAK